MHGFVRTAGNSQLRTYLLSHSLRRPLLSSVRNGSLRFISHRPIPVAPLRAKRETPWRLPGFVTGFRPLPAYSFLLAAQIVFIYVFINASNHAEDNAYGDQSTLLNTSDFTAYTLTRKEVVSQNSSILTLEPAVVASNASKPSTWLEPVRLLLRYWRGGVVPTLERLERQKEKQDLYQQALWEQGVWSVEIKQPQLMIARRYTPLPPDSTNVASPSTLSPIPTSNQARHDERSKPKAQGMYPEALGRFLQDTLKTPTEDDIKHTFPDPIKLFVRREPQGEVSRYLHSLPEGSTVELRGGFAEYEIAQDVREVVFVAGGTGIAPALGVAQAFSARRSDARVQVLWANRRREDSVGGRDSTATSASSPFRWVNAVIGGSPKSQQSDQNSEKDAKGAMVKLLESFERSEAPKGLIRRGLDLSTRYFVDEDGTFIKRADISSALQTAASRNSDAVPLRGRQLILVSGPDGFVEYIAGPKILRDGIEHQGPVGGLLSGVDLKGWEVWKL